MVSLSHGHFILLVSAGMTIGACTELISSEENPNPVGEFEAPRDQVELLPYHVRMQRLQNLVGVEADDAALEALRAGASELGAHDYGKGIRPSLSWTASTMALWVKALGPFCDSEAMHAQFASFPEALGPLMQKAYGREISEGEVDAIWSAKAASNLTPSVRYQTTCLGVLSSLEFVAR